MTTLVVVAPLREGAQERARELLAEGPPFDPEETVFDRHEVFLGEREVVFLFAGRAESGGLELSAGYDTNPARLQKPIGSPVYVVAPDLLVISDWERHALVADLRGSFSGYTNNMPATIDG